MRRIGLLGIAAVSSLVASCAHVGKVVKVDPIYEPVQQVRQSFYRDGKFVPKAKKVAVFDFKGAEGTGQAFADALAAQLFATGFSVVERQNVDSILKELKLAQSGAQTLTDTQLMQKIGQMAEVDYIIVGGIVSYGEQVGQLQFDADRQFSLPFDIPDSLAVAVGTAPTPPQMGTTRYEWSGTRKPPTGLPVFANIYASARGIEVATGKIVWIDSVNVQTSGITDVTGLERLGRVMAGNFAGTYTKSVELYNFDGTEWTLPANYEEVKAAYGKYVDWIESMSVK